ncbi:MAG: M56 family metallopeptidase [Actinomycetota bacterium]|nr:M56 family metallopeptidase [Actinomycetota bacterium]
MVYLKVLTSYILPVIYDSFISLLLVLIILAILRIRDSNIKILFFFVPLIKPFLVILEKINLNEIYISSRPGTAGFRLPDPSNIINIKGQFQQGEILLLSNTNYKILAIIFFLTILFLIFRWIVIAIFYKNLALDDKIASDDAPDLFKIIDNYIKITKVKKNPDISLTQTQNYCPFVVGVRKIILVISPKLIENLTSSEKETVIYHELSHIKRNDNLIGWVALILRDLNFFNPFAYIAYFLIRSEQEADSDKLVLKFSGKDSKKIANDILNSIKKIIALERQKKVNKIFVPRQISNFFSMKMIYQKKLSHRIHSILKTNPDRIYAKTSTKILCYVLFVILLLIQIVYVVKINNIVVLLR